MRIKNLNAKNAEEAQRTAEVDIPEFLCGSLPIRQTDCDLCGKISTAIAHQTTLTYEINSVIFGRQQLIIYNS